MAEELKQAAQQALEALSLALSDVDWRVDSPTQPVIHKAHNRLQRALTTSQPAQAGEVDAKCQTCNGHGLVGGHMQDGSGYGEGCPDCNPEPAPLVKWASTKPAAQDTPEPTVTYATVRAAYDELHIECRFSDGQKFAAVTVAQGFDNLAHRIETMLNESQQATPEPVGEPFAWTSMGQIRFTPPTQDHDTYKPLYTHPAPGVPEVLFDGFAVLQALTPQAERRTSAENVSDVLDAAVRLIRAAQAKGGGNG